MGLSSCSRRRGSSVIASREEVVERAEACLRRNLANRMPIPKLCRIVGRSERGLRNAFYGGHGMSPKRWVLAERLQSVRRALRGAARPPTTVTGIATNYGFYELGRFAAAYKKEFGEAPSETLRGIRRKGATVQPRR